MNQAARSKDLLGRLEGKQLDMDHFLLECAKWTLETLDEIKWKALPEKPHQLKAYEEFEDKANLNSAYFEDNPVILAYTNIVRSTLAENRATRDWLTECYRIFIKLNEFKSAELINKKLKEEKELKCAQTQVN